jgi:predicted Fe-Mo cluster-binding NifX family protein
MKIAITSRGDHLDAQVDPRFGRCQYFVIIDPETMEWEAIENENAQLRGGSGIQAGQLMAQKDVKAVLTGHCGPNAFQALSAADIEIYTGIDGTVQEAITRYTSGQLTSTKSSTVPSHFGMNQGNRQ